MELRKGLSSKRTPILWSGPPLRRNRLRSRLHAPSIQESDIPQPRLDQREVHVDGVQIASNVDRGLDPQ
eukprot:2967140-Lingulodinium_polyedra.AAC.1